MAQQNSTGTELDKFKPKLPPILLEVGVILWRLVGWVSNIDFMMSISSDIFLTMFTFFMDYGWWIVALLGAVWIFSVHGQTKRRVISPAFIIVIAGLSFIWGILLTVHATGSVPRIIQSWGASEGRCDATFNTARLRTFRNDYDVALVCGIADSTLDRFADTRISMSALFSIQPGSFEISAPLSAGMTDLRKTMPVVSVWNEAVLIKKGTDLKIIHSLNDIGKYGGKILNPHFYDK
jgi:hypothetical protein